MEKNIVLIGFMGTGKSTIGMKLAERLKMQFIDMDREIEKLTGMSIAALFKKHGEIRFRSEERLMSQKLGARSNLVIATGGGVVLNTENVEALKKSGVLVCLDAQPEVLLARINRKKGSRPLLKKNLRIEDIEKMMKEREEHYALADFRVDTSNKEMDKIVQEIIQIIRKSNNRRVG
ncbi:MAG: shikimate kinase [Syntrophomonadaceae bacterium]|jgi:shikimate kinase|nr:shikimate kinase [Syntrophomonadaceae bacterium]